MMQESFTVPTSPEKKVHENTNFMSKLYIRQTM